MWLCALHEVKSETSSPQLHSTMDAPQQIIAIKGILDSGHEWLLRAVDRWKIQCCRVEDCDYHERSLPSLPLWSGQWFVKSGRSLCAHQGVCVLWPGCREIKLSFLQWLGWYRQARRSCRKYHNSNNNIQMRNSYCWIKMEVEERIISGLEMTDVVRCIYRHREGMTMGDINEFLLLRPSTSIYHTQCTRLVKALNKQHSSNTCCFQVMFVLRLAAWDTESPRWRSPPKKSRLMSSRWVFHVFCFSYAYNKLNCFHVTDVIFDEVVGWDGCLISCKDTSGAISLNIQFVGCKQRRRTVTPFESYAY